MPTVIIKKYFVVNSKSFKSAVVLVRIFSHDSYMCLDFVRKKQKFNESMNFDTKQNMRLSLKTILAYTDNLFDTESRPAIEKRIGDEGVAGYLIDRIRSVVRKSDLPVPGRNGDQEELSANLVAAYLDNRLSDTEQSQFETICLRSEVYLAEVACTHQILTTILGQPAKLDPGNPKRITCKKDVPYC